MAKGRSYLAGALLVALVETSWGQKAPNWRAYKGINGLQSPVCSTVTVAPHGKVLVTHPGISGVSELDGYKIQFIPAPFSPQNRVYESPAGQLWTVETDGLWDFKPSQSTPSGATNTWTVEPEALLGFRGGTWSAHAVPEIEAEFKARRLPSPDPVPLHPVRQGLVLVLLPSRLLQFDCTDPSHPRTTVLRRAEQTQLGGFTGLCPARGDGGLWVAGTRGLAKVSGPARALRAETEWREYPFAPALQVQNLQEAHEDKNGNITATAETTATHQKVIVHFDGEQWSAEPGTVERLRFAWRGPDGGCWAANPTTLFQYQEGGTEMSEYEEISARSYNDLAIEPGGAFWLATSDGLFRYAPLAWRSLAGAQRAGSPIRCLAMDNQGRLWHIAGTATPLDARRRAWRIHIPARQRAPSPGHAQPGPAQQRLVAAQCRVPVVCLRAGCRFLGSVGG